MHLINTDTLKLETVTSEEHVHYAILSHRWEQSEVLYEDLEDLLSCTKPGVHKVKAFCSLAQNLNYKYAWVDTCCIDKKSSADLAEAINSMYRYYQSAGICVAYLSDVHTSGDRDSAEFEASFRSSLWFTRCWTLQELLAPRHITFFNSAWRKLDTKQALLPLISDITHIDISALKGAPLTDFSIAQRMSWASRRQATRTEDVAYSLMGIFDINMPMLYGEGRRAFTRLQEEILRYSDDETIFAWTNPDATLDFRSGLLSSSPAYFRNCKYLRSTKLHDRTETFVLTNRGIAGSLFITPKEQTDGSTLYLAYLNASHKCPHIPEQFVGIYLRVVTSGADSTHTFERVMSPVLGFKAHCWLGSHLKVSASKITLFSIRVRHKDQSIQDQPQPAHGFELGKFIVIPTKPKGSIFSKDVKVDSSQITLASDAQWAPINDTRHSMIVRLFSSIKGPMCEVVYNNDPKGTIVIQLGLSTKNLPICIIVDSHIVNHSGARLPFQYESLTSPYWAENNDALWTRNCRRRHRRDAPTPYEPYVMLPDQRYTGIYAFKVESNEATRWLCIQPDLNTGSYQHRARWRFSFSPCTWPNYRLWVFEMEKVSTELFY